MNKEQVMQVVSEWLDAVCKSPSGDHSLRIEKQAYIGKDGQIDAVRMMVKAENIVAVAELPMQLVQGPPEKKLVTL